MSNTNGRMTLKMRWLIWRARMSTPALLTRFDEKKVVSGVTAINGGLAILTIGILAWLLDLPLLFPALGPSTFILFSTPLSRAGAPRSVVLGHWICLATGYGCWQVMSTLTGEPVVYTNGDWPVFAGASAALALSGFFLVSAGCPHPPACASSLVVALGMITHPKDLLLMAVVVAWLAFQAVLMNRFAGLPVPWWSYQPRE